MRLVPLLASLTLASMSGVAQVPGPPPHAASLEAQQQLSGAGCPVAFEARHGEQGGVVNVQPDPHRMEQSYRITFLPGSAQSIVQARITLHGISGAVTMPAAKAGPVAAASTDTTESFTLALHADAEHRFRATVYAARLTGVQAVELKELRYADGRTWREPAAGTCLIRPNGYMLVAHTR